MSVPGSTSLQAKLVLLGFFVFFLNLDGRQFFVAKQPPSWGAIPVSGPRPRTIGARSQGEEELPACP